MMVGMGKMEDFQVILRIQHRINWLRDPSLIPRFHLGNKEGNGFIVHVSIRESE